MQKIAISLLTRREIADRPKLTSLFIVNRVGARDQIAEAVDAVTEALKGLDGVVVPFADRVGIAVFPNVVDVFKAAIASEVDFPKIPIHMSKLLIFFS